MNLKENSEENLINCHISIPDFSRNIEGQSSPSLDIITKQQNSLKYDTTTKLHPTLLSTFVAYPMRECGGKLIEISSGKTLNISYTLTPE